MTANSHYVFLFISFFLNIGFATPVKRAAANADEYMDKLLVNVREYIKTSNADSIPVPQQKFLNIRATGKLHGLSTLYRAGSTSLQFHENDDNIQVNGIFGVRKLTANLECSSNFGLFTRSSKVDANAVNAKVEISLKANLNTKKVVLTKFKVVNIGKITVDIKRKRAPRWHKMMSRIFSGISNLFKNQMAKLFEQRIRPLIQKALDNIGTTGLTN